MNYRETLGLIADRFGERVDLTVYGSSELGSVVKNALGTLEPGSPMGARRAAAYDNAPDVEIFAFKDLPGVRFFVGESDFRDADVRGDTLTIRLGPHRTEIRIDRLAA